MVKNKANLNNTEETNVDRTPKVILYVVIHMLNQLVLIFSIILMLMLGFTLQHTSSNVTKVYGDDPTVVKGGIISNMFSRDSMYKDIVSKSSKKTISIMRISFENLSHMGL